MTHLEPWREHPLARQGLVEMVPVEWLLRYSGNDVGDDTTLQDGSRISLSELWESIKREGLKDPLIMRVGIRNKKFRLESGNHRIRLLQEHGIKMVPLTVQVREECGPNATEPMNSGTHNFDAIDIKLPADTSREYIKPSSIFQW